MTAGQEQAPADRILDQGQRLLGFACLGLGGLGTIFGRIELLLLGLDTPSRLLECPGRVPQLALGGGDDFELRLFGGLSAGFAGAGPVLDAAEQIRGLDRKSVV